MIPRTAADSPPAASAVSAASSPSSAQPPGRDRYFDLLRALALFRVVLYHLVGWAWLPLLFPSMGVMFALAGSLMARSLARPAAQVIRGRIRRLLPPMWALGVVGVTGMVMQGWRPGLSTLFWILPLSDPPFTGEAWAVDLAEPLWYLRAYLWFVLLSPLLLRALRRSPLTLTTILAPLVLSVALSLGFLSLPERIDSALTDFSTFGACWILGMARQEGILSRLPRYVVPSLAPFVMLAGLVWAVRHDVLAGNDLDSVPTAQALWSFGAVLLLFHVSPSWKDWPRRLRRWDGVITLLNSRAVTVYLWHNICIFVAAALWDLTWDVDLLGEQVPWLLESWVPVLILAWALIALCVPLFGWAEDLAAKRRPRLWPNGGVRDAGVRDVGVVGVVRR